MSSNDAEKRRLVQDLTVELREDNLAIFAGAGLSVPSGFVTWKDFLKPIAEELDLDVQREDDLISLAQYYTNVHQGNRGKLNQLLIDKFCRDAKISDNHKILSRLPIPTYWTTNYDKLIELALEQAGKIPDVKHTKKQLVVTRRKRDAIVYKMHGDSDHPSEAVLIKDDYEKYHIDRTPFLNALQGDLISKTFLFLGFSFTDPNLDYILSRVRVAYEKDQRQHHCILRAVRREKGTRKADYEYAKRKQDLFLQDLRRFGIKTCLVDEYDETTEILREIERQFRRTTLFVSGAAHEYSPYTANEATKFVSDVSRDLIKSGRQIVSGFGLGVGNAVVTGALEQIYMSGETLRSSEQLIMRPFPQRPTESEDMAKLWTQYRRDMLSYAGVALFLFGNKQVDGNVVPSNGMREEFEIAKKKGLLLLPVGATGYMARELWGEVSSNFEKLNPSASSRTRNLFGKLGKENADLSQLRSDISDVLEMLTK